MSELLDDIKADALVSESTSRLIDDFFFSNDAETQLSETVIELLGDPPLAGKAEVKDFDSALKIIFKSLEKNLDTILSNNEMRLAPELANEVRQFRMFFHLLYKDALASPIMLKKEMFANSGKFFLIIFSWLDKDDLETPEKFSSTIFYNEVVAFNNSFLKIKNTFFEQSKKENKLMENISDTFSSFSVLINPVYATLAAVFIISMIRYSLLVRLMIRKDQATRRAFQNPTAVETLLRMLSATKEKVKPLFFKFNKTILISSVKIFKELLAKKKSEKSKDISGGVEFVRPSAPATTKQVASNVLI